MPTKYIYKTEEEENNTEECIKILCTNSFKDLSLGSIHKLRHTLRGAEGVDEV